MLMMTRRILHHKILSTVDQDFWYLAICINPLNIL